MTIEKFIEKAIEGGWEKDKYPSFWSFNDIVKFYQDKVFLDPLAWQAVGKVEGWKDYMVIDNPYKNIYLYHMHEMIDALAEGKSLSEFIETL